jgi:hypothetical protein
MPALSRPIAAVTDPALISGVGKLFPAFALPASAATASITPNPNVNDFIRFLLERVPRNAATRFTAC